MTVSLHFSTVQISKSTFKCSNKVFLLSDFLSALFHTSANTTLFWASPHLQWHQKQLVNSQVTATDVMCQLWCRSDWFCLPRPSCPWQPAGRRSAPCCAPWCSRRWNSAGWSRARRPSSGQSREAKATRATLQLPRPSCFQLELQRASASASLTSS